MCDACGCSSGTEGLPARKKIDVKKSLLDANDRQAAVNREHLESMGAVALNLISSPGAGKTTLLEQTIMRVGNRWRIGVLEGDIETERDADRIRRHGIPAVQITTGGACHLDAPLVHRALHQLEEQGRGKGFDLVFIENVGNLVCPAAFRLGEHLKVVILSVPEGSDKPAKYPRAFIDSDLFIISKIDLVEHFDFSMDEAEHEARRLNPDLEITRLSAVSGENLDEWIDFLERAVTEYAGQR
jgi:hydrogenase nickel incorporation protein HypB